jgi:hypothetical protein
MPQLSQRRVSPAAVALPFRVRRHPRALVSALKTRPSVHTEMREDPSTVSGLARGPHAMHGAFELISFYPGTQGRYAPPRCAGQSVREGAAQGGAAFGSTSGSLCRGSTEATGTPWFVCVAVGPTPVAPAGSHRYRGFMLGAPEATPNPSVEARPNGGTPGPPSGVVYHPPVGPGVPPPGPPHLER